MSQISIDQADDYTMLAERYEEAGQYDEARYILELLKLITSE